MRAKFGRDPTVVSKKGGGSTDTQIMKLLQVCQVQYCPANNVSNCGGDPVTQ